MLVGRTSARTSQAFLLAAMLSASVGCQNWPQSQRMMQQQIESERLLSEYRAQKKRADELESKNRQLSDRLSESEKMLARLQSTPDNSRLASRESTSSTSSSVLRSGSVADYSNDYRSQLDETSRRPAPTRSQNSQQPVWQSLSRP